MARPGNTFTALVSTELPTNTNLLVCTIWWSGSIHCLSYVLFGNCPVHSADKWLCYYNGSVSYFPPLLCCLLIFMIVLMRLLMPTKKETRASPMFVCKSCHAGHQEDSRCRIRGKSEESVACRQGSTQVRESTLALKLRAEITRSPKEGYQWPHKRTDVLQI